MRVIEVWRYQLQQHADFPYIFRGLDESAGSVTDKARIARDAMALARITRETCILAVNYESFWLEPFASLAMHTAWPLIIADECHRLKQASGKCSRFMGRLATRATHRLGLTGTPLPHSKLDLWAQFRFIERHMTTTHSRPQAALRHGGGYQGRELKGWRDENRAGSFSISFRAKEVPTCRRKEGHRLVSHWSVYDQLENDFMAWLGDTPEEELTVSNALVLLLRLQQLTGGTLRDDQHQEHLIDRNKEALLADWLLDQPRDEPIVIFARFKADLAAIARACKRSGITSSEVSGSSPGGIAPWQAGETQVLAAQIQVGSAGPDFTRARYCVFYSMGFKLFEYIQARARVHRAGQTRPTTYFHLLCRNTVDEKVLRAVQNRWEIVETVLKELKANATRKSVS
jgi:SNF2 family DNA or RNA helicase